MEQAVEQGAIRIARRRVHHQTGRLVHDEQMLILEDDLQRKGLREIRDRPFPDNPDMEILTAGQAIARASDSAIDRHPALPDPLLKATSGKLGQQLAQDVIEAPASRAGLGQEAALLNRLVISSHEIPGAQ
jgi:hypothetical protein